MIRVSLITLALLGGLMAAPAAYADEPPVYTSWRNNLGAQGYDVVSFFTGNAVKGKPKFTTMYQGAEWQFSTRANLDLFKTNPEAFAPQYGGYCAWAIAQGKLAKGRGEYFHVEDGKLYLNFNARIQRRWDRSREDYIAEADENWPDILKE